MSQINLFFKQNRRQFLLFTTVATLAGYINIVKGQNMHSTKHFKSFIEWDKIRPTIGARTITINGITEYVVPSMTHTSYPVPIRHEGQLQIVFMVCRLRLQFGGSQIWPPNKIIRFEPINGKIINETMVSPTDFGQADSTDKELPEWKLRQKTNMTGNMFDNLVKRLLELYNVLFAAWADNPSPAGQGRLQNQAQDFLRIFDQLAEEPLKPYYEALGRDWFGWLRALAQ